MDTEKKASYVTMPGNKSGKSSNSSNLQTFDVTPSLRFKDSRSITYSTQSKELDTNKRASKIQHYHA